MDNVNIRTSSTVGSNQKNDLRHSSKDVQLKSMKLKGPSLKVIPDRLRRVAPSLHHKNPNVAEYAGGNFPTVWIGYYYFP